MHTVLPRSKPLASFSRKFEDGKGVNFNLSFEVFMSVSTAIRFQKTLDNSIAKITAKIQDGKIVNNFEIDRIVKNEIASILPQGKTVYSFSLERKG